MKGSVHKRCLTCGRRVKGRVCTYEGCKTSGYGWEFVVDAGRRADGRRRQVRRTGFKTRAAAEEALEQLTTQRRAGFDPPTQLLVSDFLLERWLPRTRTSVKTHNDRSMHMRRYVIPRIGDLHLLQLTGDDLTEMYDDLAVRGRTQKPDPALRWGLSPTTVRRIHTQLHKAFADAIRWGLLQRNPCDQADPPSSTEVRSRALASRRVYSWAELQRFIAAAAQHRHFAMWQLFATTGMRRSEMVALRWDHVDLETGLISVVRAAVENSGQVHEKELPKSSSSRRAVELAPADVEVLALHQAQQESERLAAAEAWRHEGHVFASLRGGRLYPPDVTRTFHELTDGAGLPRIRLHDLRHTHATLLLKAGEITKVVTERLGHATTAYTQDAYQHVLPGMQRDAATRFHDRLTRLPTDHGTPDEVAEQGIDPAPSEPEDAR